MAEVIRTYSNFRIPDMGSVQATDSVKEPPTLLDQAEGNEVLALATDDTARELLPNPRALGPQHLETVVRLYAQGMSQLNISKQCRMSQNSVLKLLKQAGVPRRRPGRPRSSSVYIAGS